MVADKKSAIMDGAGILDRSSAIEIVMPHHVVPQYAPTGNDSIGDISFLQ